MSNKKKKSKRTQARVPKIIIVAICLIGAVLSLSAIVSGFSLGDVNHDGDVKANDARFVLRFAAKLDEMIDEFLADWDGNGQIKANDARGILRYFAGLEKETRATEKQTGANNTTSVFVPSSGGFSLDMVPGYSGDSYVTVNNNIPFFSEDDFTTDSYEYYSPLDSLGRCGYAMSCIGTDLMPTEKRGNISSVKPTGWHSVQYPVIPSGALYNRCHLIGYQLTAENANERNLITGTRYMNEAMIPFETMAADFIKETGEHVLYRVTPYFEGENLVASGVLMEA